MKKNEGFSLVELIIVIAIMAILIGVLAPQYIKYVEKARKTTDEDVADTLLSTGYMLTMDDDYVQSINVGDKIIFSATGITTTPFNTTTESGMDEYSPGWRDKKIRSNTYKGRQYIVRFITVTGASTFTVEGSWGN